MVRALEPDSHERHRSVPLQDTITRIPGYPRKLVIFKIPASSYWWVRYYAEKHIFKRTTKTEIKRDALEAAKRFYDDIKRMEWRFNGPGKESTYFCAVGEKLTPDDGLIKRFTMTKDLSDLIVFMVNSYIRPTDVRNMQHKHVEVIKREWTYLRLTLPPSKGHSFPTTTMPWAVKVYERICRRQEIEFGRPVGPEDFVFMPHAGTRDSAIKSLAKQFDIVLALTGLKISNVGEPRSLYSLRHSSIMFRLMFGRAVDTLTLARNARTSPEMIDRFYAAPLQGEMNVGELQSKRRPRPWELNQAK